MDIIGIPFDDIPGVYPSNKRTNLLENDADDIQQLAESKGFIKSLVPGSLIALPSNHVYYSICKQGPSHAVVWSTVTDQPEALNNLATFPGLQAAP